MWLLERASLSAPARAELTAALRDDAVVTEAAVLSTCNRLEIYAAITRFHSGLAVVSHALAQRCGVELEQLTPHLYVHFEGAAVEHAFAVAAGLDSMAVGEQQILGQVRMALREGQNQASVGRTLGPLLQQALRVGKRVHAETELGRAGTSLVASALDEAQRMLGDLSQRSVLVLGAGAMGGLAVAGVQRAGVGRVAVYSRTLERAERLASSVSGQVVSAQELPKALAQADIVLACTGAVGYLIDADLAARASADRHGEPQVYLDLALPRDIDPEVDALPAVAVIDLERIGQLLADQPVASDITSARELVDAEVAGYLAEQQVLQVVPTVAALRTMANEVVLAELERLRSRLGEGAAATVMPEVEQMVHRVVEKLLHTPTVRVKELATLPNGAQYAQALRELFDLDLTLPQAVSSPAGSVASDRAASTRTGEGLAT